jgi:hypothetical protein
MDAQNKQEKISLRVFFFEIEPRVQPQVRAPLHIRTYVCAFQWICHFPLQTHTLSRVCSVLWPLAPQCVSKAGISLREALIEACLQST